MAALLCPQTMAMSTTMKRRDRSIRREVGTPLKDFLVEHSALDFLQRCHIADLYRPVNEPQDLARRDCLQRAPRQGHARCVTGLPLIALAGDLYLPHSEA
jgi:hypothetical protein